MSLFDIFYHGGIEFDADAFPWSQAEEQAEAALAGELGSGSFGFWQLTRLRGNLIRKQILDKTPKALDAQSFDFLGFMRNWGKLRLIKPGKLAKNPETGEYEPTNPFAWHLAGIVWTHGPRNKKAAMKKYGEERTVRQVNLHGAMEGSHQKGAGHVSGFDTAVKDLLANAVAVGLISEDESGWINGLVS